MERGNEEEDEEARTDGEGGLEGSRNDNLIF